MFAIGESAAVHAALASGLLVALAEGGGTAAHLAAGTHTDARMAGAVLDVLAQIGLAVRDGDAYAPSPALAGFARTAPGGIRLEGSLWGQLPQVLSTGVAADIGDLSQAERYRSVTARLADLLGAEAATLAQTVALPDDARVLDLGCGSGVWSIALAHARPHARVVGVDFAPVLETLRAHAAQRGVADRVESREGDARTVALEPAGYDAIVVANLLRLGDPAFWRAVLTNARPALKPGGRMIVVDALSEETPLQARGRAVYALHLMTRQQTGTVPTVPALTALYAELGLVDVATHPVGGPASFNRALVARAPG
jgi:ubiquinone/menaquinone biosynthesis C-methylase UbiE